MSTKANFTKWGVIVVGGGHAGIEAALISARMGISTLLITSDRTAIGRMPCNPSVGGLAKSHLVYELDALGGEMGFNADQTALQEKTLNTSRGPAVRATRAQCDKELYTRRMQKVIEAQENLSVLEDAVTDLLVHEFDVEPPSSMGQLKNTFFNHVERVDRAEQLLHDSTRSTRPIILRKRGFQVPPIAEFSPPRPHSHSHSEIRGIIEGVRTENNGEFYADAVVVTSGTALRGRIFIGHEMVESGGDGRPAANRLSVSLEKLGFELIRLKTGTPPRLKASTCDFSRCIQQNGEIPPPLFSLRSRCSTWNTGEQTSQGQEVEDNPYSTWNIPNIPCWMTHTTAEATREYLSDETTSDPFFTEPTVAYGA